MAELTWWSFLAFGMLPLPVVLIIILSSPAPRDVRKGVLWFVEQVLSFEMRRPFLVMHVALILTGAHAAWCLYLRTAPVLPMSQCCITLPTTPGKVAPFRQPKGGEQGTCCAESFGQGTPRIYFKALHSFGQSSY
jgi:hypothetical protein